MISKAMVIVIAALVAGGAAAGITAVYVLHQSGSSETQSSQNNGTSGSNSGNKLTIGNHYYFFGPDPRNPFRETTYVYMQLSDVLIYNDFVHIYVGAQDLARWWVNRTQAYHNEIAVPLDILTNLNGTINIEIKRANETLYNGSLLFYCHPHISVTLKELKITPLNYKYAYLRGFNASVYVPFPTYLDSVDVKISNTTDSLAICNVEYGTHQWESDYGYFFGHYPLIEKGYYNVTLSVEYPLFPDGGEGHYTMTVPYNVSFEWHNVSIENVSLSDEWEHTVMDLHLNSTCECPLNFTLYNESGEIVDNKQIVADVPVIEVYFSKAYNFNGTYTAILRDYFGELIDKFTFSYYSGPLKLVNHSEYLYNYSWENYTDFESFTVSLLNTGNARNHIVGYNYTISYASNGTVIKSDENQWVDMVIKPGDIRNITEYPYIELPNDELYTVTITLYGSNSNLIYVVSFQIRT